MKKPSKALNRKFARLKEKDFKNPDEFVQYVELGTKQRRIINEELFPRMDALAILVAKMFTDFDKVDIKRFKDHLYYKGSEDPKYKERGKALEKDIEKVIKQLLLCEIYGENMTEIFEIFEKNGFTVTRNRTLPLPKL